MRKYSIHSFQDPNNTQNYNKYSYVLNNPLKFTDPSGYKRRYRNLNRIKRDPSNNSYWRNFDEVMSGAYWQVMANIADGFIKTETGVLGGGAPTCGSASGPGSGRSGTHGGFSLDGGGDNLGSALATHVAKEGRPIYPPKIDFSQGSYREQMRRTYLWIQTNSHSIDYLLLDDLVDFASLKNSKYFIRAVTFYGSNYRSKSEPLVTIQDQGTMLIPEVSIKIAGTLSIDYDYTVHPPTATYHPGRREGYVYVYVPSVSTENYSGRRDVGMTIRFTLESWFQYLYFKYFNNSIGGAHVDQ